MEFIVTGTNVQAKATEPTLNEVDKNGVNKPLNDLGKSTIKFQVAGEPDPVIAKEVTASSPTGGGAIDETIVIPALDEKEVTVELWMTSTDTTGHESVASEKTILVVDNLAPLPPS